MASCIWYVALMIRISAFWCCSTSQFDNIRYETLITKIPSLFIKVTLEHLEFVIAGNRCAKLMFKNGIYYMLQCGRKCATSENLRMFAYVSADFLS
jgi:hypothetical protein